MLKSLLLTVLVSTTVLADEELVILHSPDSLDIKGEELIDQSLLTDLFTGVLGYTVKSHKWSGIYVKNPFNLPEAVVSIAVEGVESLRSHERKHYPLNVDELEETTWQAVCRVVVQRDTNNTLIRMRAGDGFDALGQSALGELKIMPIEQSMLQNLDLKDPIDRKFIEEFQLLRAIAQNIPSMILPNSRPDVYWFVVTELRPVLEHHGEKSAAANEAYGLLNKALNDLSEAFVNAYRGNVFIAAFTTDANKVDDNRPEEFSRVRRQVDASTSAPKSTESTASNNNIEKDAMEKSENVNENMEEDSNSRNENESISSNKSVTENQGELKKISESNNTVEVTEVPGHELDYRGHVIHSMTEKEIIKKPLQIKTANLAKKYSANYPVIFNIFLWFGVAFLFSLIAICIAIAEMDPGRDSVIYRMTSNRMKKDN